MDYFHVFVRKEGETALRVVALDLAEDEIKRHIVKPYCRGTSIVQGGKITPVASLGELRICMTSTAFEQAYSSEHAAQSKKIDELNRGGGVFFLSPGPGHDDMADSFENVTSRFLGVKEPGQAGRPHPLIAITNHPIISTVVGGIVLAGLAFYLGWK